MSGPAPDTPSSGAHRAAAAASAGSQSVPCAVVTISDTRTPETDRGGDLVARLLATAGHEVRHRAIVPDDVGPIESSLAALLADGAIRCVLTTGGTGIARRDTTIEVVARLLTAELPGFGEIFRMLSFAEVGAAAMLSRAVGGLVARAPERGGDTFVFAMPGSVNAVELAMTRLVVPELSHLVWERR